MKKAYECHEVAYRKMREKGIYAWEQIQGTKRKAIESETRRFLSDTLSQPWAPKNGRVVEIGCGTAPILRWICNKGFKGLGLDVSKTAITMAREQTKGLNIQFKQADVCHLNFKKTEKSDIVIDGHCLHCITRPIDRRALFNNTLRLLRKGGLFIVMTVCSPVDRNIFSEVCKGQKLINHIIYAPFGNAKEYVDSRAINGQAYIPTRTVLYWKGIISEIKKAGFQIKLLRHNKPKGQDPFSTLSIAALK